MSEQQKNIPVVEAEQDFTEVVRVRREKLSNLVQNGKNPYEITNFDINSNSKKVTDEFDENLPEGEVQMVKMKKISFEKMPLPSGTIIDFRLEKKNKWRKENDQWIQINEYEDWLSWYDVVAWG